MSPANKQNLTSLHQWATLTVIPALLSLILYFLIDVHKTIKVSSDAVIRHEQKINDHDQNIKMLQQYVFKSK
jgi:hypothetical protein